jgi:hypothetical protein
MNIFRNATEILFAQPLVTNFSLASVVRSY